MKEIVAKKNYSSGFDFIYKSLAGTFFILPFLSEIIRYPLRAFSSLITFSIALSKATFILSLKSSHFLTEFISL